MHKMTVIFFFFTMLNISVASNFTPFVIPFYVSLRDESWRWDFGPYQS